MVLSAERQLLVCDLDGTLIGDDSALNEFANWLESRRDQVVLAFSSGRLHWSILEAMQEFPLPHPDYLIGGVGTEIRDDVAGIPWASWSEQFESWSADVVRSTLLECAMLEYQPEEVQSDFKVSYFGWSLQSPDLSAIEQRLTDAGVKFRLIYSSDRDLDVVPARAGKGAAALFLAKQLGIPVDQVIGCGDSGNDRCLVEQSGRGVVVANALPELRKLRGPHLYHSPYPYAAGVLDGVRYWRQKA